MGCIEMYQEFQTNSHDTYKITEYMLRNPPNLPKFTVIHAPNIMGFILHWESIFYCPFARIFNIAFVQCGGSIVWQYNKCICTLG